ncbi:Uu.00g096010.m01.CDS01 [Anthostomella pinea]|uniref:Uu.00g096010.m01.CDS01 n=1 Tax=Anthostomella pinea TaxID=933095 RepID=A0AAI8VCP1_9PEZI|nr:Uu.00g096010.m01.CDS01 [Anthostomella pinea]
MAARTGLLAFPNELLFQILDHVHDGGQDTDSVHAVIRTCKALKPMAEACLYSSITLLKRSQLKPLTACLEADPVRKTYIRDLQLPWSTRLYEFGESAPLDLCSLPGLTSFVSESPFCNAHYRYQEDRVEDWINVMESYLRGFERASLLSNSGTLGERPLKNLRHLTLHWTGGDDGGRTERFWPITPSCPVFLMPSLHSLEISCVYIKSSVPGESKSNWAAEILPFARRTNLKSLIITRGGIPAEALLAILALPKALETFILREAVPHRESGPGSVATEQMDIFQQAIAQQSETLKMLHIQRNRRSSTQRQLSIDLSGFQSLSEFHVGPYISDRVFVWKLSDPMPPMLTRLRLMECFVPDMAYWHQFRSDVLLDDLVGLARVRNAAVHLDIVLRKVVTMGNWRHGLRDIGEDFRARYLASGEQLESSPPPEATAQPRLRFFTVGRSGYSPPYLYHERSPRSTLFYDSSNPRGFVDNDDDDDSSSFVVNFDAADMLVEVD